MAVNYTISEEYELPSRGLLYNPNIESKIRLRSMTTMEEMKRLSPSNTPYKTMSEIIDSCIVDKPDNFHTYDLCLGDYQFLLHKLRIITYGKDYKTAIRCNLCNNVSDITLNLEDLKVKYYDESIKDLLVVKLPRCNKLITLKLQTPRTLDEINIRKNEIIEKSGDTTNDQTYLLTIISLIDKIDGENLVYPKLESFVRNMELMDVNILMNKAEKLMAKVGLETNLTVKCPKCGEKVETTFRTTSEFFGPTVD